jgi:hypothetical protein
MSYYKYNFISPEPLYAKIKLELQSYFDVGVVDDLLFPLWATQALRRLSRATLPINETVLYLEDYSAILPEHFKYVREAWICTDMAPVSIRKPGGSQYMLAANLLNPNKDRCKIVCLPEQLQFIYKINEEAVYTNSVSHLLRPGNISAFNSCGEVCANRGVRGTDIQETFDIRDGRFVTNFRQGDVYLIYYAEETDANANVLIPENVRLENFVEAYIKYKIFEQIWNSVTDETFNQVTMKLQKYEADMYQAQTMAEIEIKKQTLEQKLKTMKRESSRFNRFEIR